MKILKIGGKNLASLAGDFCVDFEQEPLASSGLFAISGPTGAGKSTLLDALCLALYDATPRLLRALGRSVLPDVGMETISSQDTRTLLRRGAAEGHAEVDFIGNDGAAYRARWSVRRSRTKAEGALQPTTMSLAMLPALQPLGGTKTEVKAEIEKRIGLSFEQFTRAVLLAQNEFSAFLKAEDNERGELLETLTGSTIYSEISMRAFERAKLEQAALQKLNARLADQKPMNGEQRTELEAQSAASNQALQALDRRKAELEHRLRWHQQAAKLRDEEQLAQQAWQHGMDQLAAATPRRAALALSDAVQPARPLAEEMRRIGSDIAQAQSAIAVNAQQAGQAGLALEQSSVTLARAALQLQEAEQGLRRAAPQLDQAKALDARIDAMLPAHRQAAAARETADLAEAAARSAMRDKQEQQQKLAAQQEAGAAWLAQHRQWQALAQSWARWDVLFVQAGQAASQAEKLASALARVQRSAKGHREDEADATARLAAAGAQLQALEAQRQEAIRRLAAFPADQLQASRRQLEQRRDLLAGAEKIWLELEARQARSNQIEAQSAQLRQARDQAGLQLAQAQQEHIAIMAAFAQAERSLRLAETACAENVETLRAALEDDTPCPVCGAHEHPYRHNDGPLQAMLAGLQSEVARCRKQMEANVQHQATQRAAVQTSLEQLALLADESRKLQQLLDRVAGAWSGHALVAQTADKAQESGQTSMPPEAQRSAWFEQQLSLVRAGLQSLEQQERELHSAGNARDQAQAACDRAAADHARLLSAASSAQTALARINTEHKALDEQRIEVALQLSALLSDLDPAFSDGDIPGEEWKEDWKAGPARFHAARQAESKQWLAQRGAQDEREATRLLVEVELKTLSAACGKAEQDAAAARGAYAAADQALLGTQQQRMALWDGKEVREIEGALSAAIDQARASLTRHQSASQQAAQDKTRLDEALAQATRRLEVLQESALTAAAKLSDWLAAFQQRQPEAGLQDMEQLRALLAQDGEGIEAERQSLQALERAAASAATVLKERQRQREQHQLSAPLADSADLDPDTPSEQNESGQDAAERSGPDRGAAQQSAALAQLAAALERLGAESKAAHDSATGLQLELAQDDARRRHAQAVLVEIEQQEAVEQRWARMSDLIGSADGKKFRNYAQQFTLDVLLGYANAHLNQLARRYQLERIGNPSSPSLALLVRDLNMGGEMRSVHSLSGGESFLVSLALALGLASLSSNRVRVESLFIDEGFGSLDAETLRVAMDALDGLQAMGRKVGVISHVQEMTERISTRILVQPSAGGKSIIRVQ